MRWYRPWSVDSQIRILQELTRSSQWMMNAWRLRRPYSTKRFKDRYQVTIAFSIHPSDAREYRLGTTPRGIFKEFELLDRKSTTIGSSAAFSGPYDYNIEGKSWKGKIVKLLASREEI
ncbi:predicted protein [Sclerotinia sclerotiorum 1980 UF-70]|uniref:Uncharacterized protein n=1 Tax=Sclerotinia sclerotiorum (strain ATCC 18683 / 1980 / Ss-1) TaxID=665079 RepID=A7EYR4_SCLS1|nr:predicted protein [Sclerotinia sclerotiorum 1980 UF-70]EDN94606.1 predicted protein [Sclerotinia sclerotiorum 1980 UF-70]